MKLTKNFITHPTLATILNSCLMILGLLCWKNLSVREYPEIVFPVITVSTYYANASNETVETNITNILENQLSSIEGLDSISSSSDTNFSNIKLRFKSHISMGKALNDTQNSVSRAQSLLPEKVKQPEIRKKDGANGLPFIGISLSSSILDYGALTHYAELNLKNQFKHIIGVGSVDVWGQEYTYNIRLDPQLLFNFGVNPTQVKQALAQYNLSLPTGKFNNTTPSSLDTKLSTRSDIENVVVATQADTPILLKQLATVTLQTNKSQTRFRINGKPGLLLSINISPDANPLQVSKQVKTVLKQLKKNLPKNLHLNLAVDQSSFIEASIKSIQHAIIEAIILVLLIVFIFLKNVKATLIPLLAIPISLLGNFVALSALGYSINLMTLLGMMLGIGLIVDDAIIMLENIWRHIEKGLRPIDAAIKGASEMGFAILAMTATLGCVYIPIAFMQNLIGQLFIQFAVSLAGSVLISGFVAISLSPFMCAKLLKPQSKAAPSNSVLNKLCLLYERCLKWIISLKKTMLAILIISMLASIGLYITLPKEVAPKEDRSLIGIYIPPIQNETQNNQELRAIELEKRLPNYKEFKNTIAILGDWGINFVLPLNGNTDRIKSSKQLVNDLQPKFSNLVSIDPYVWNHDSGLPGISSNENTADISFEISAPDTYQTLFENVDKLIKKLEHSPVISSVSQDLHLNTLAYNIHIDQQKIHTLGISAKDIAETINIYFSGDKSEYFVKDGLNYHLTIETSKPAASLYEIYYTLQSGQKISLGTLASIRPQAKPQSLSHYQQQLSTKVSIQLKSKAQLGKVIQLINQLKSETLPYNYQLHWKGTAKLQKETNNNMVVLLLLAIIFIYSILAIQFKSFIDPLLILITVPLAGIFSLLVIYIFNQSLNIYTEIGLVTLIGLISKHGILLVEFANQLLAKGHSPKEAMLKAAKLRFRPILMTTSAMIFGLLPLLYSYEAGYESRYAISIVLISGLGLGTLFTLFVLPSIYTQWKSK